MRYLLPPKSRIEVINKSVRPGRNVVGHCLISFGVVLAAIALKASVPIHRPPYVTWIPDQRVTTSGQGFATQYFRIIDFDSLGFGKMKRSSMAFYSTMNIMIQNCNIPGDAAVCAQDGTGYKIIFNTIPTSDGYTTITIQAAQTGTGLSGYTSFTLQRDTMGTINQTSPTIENLPSYTLPTTSTYTTEFVIGDLDASNKEDVCESVLQGAPCTVTVPLPTPTYTSTNPNLAPSFSLNAMPIDPLPIESEVPGRRYVLTATNTSRTRLVLFRQSRISH